MSERLEIEDTSDCQACEIRHRDRFELMQHETIQCIGQAWCHECGREYEVIAGVSESLKPVRKWW